MNYLNVHLSLLLTGTSEIQVIKIFKKNLPLIRGERFANKVWDILIQARQVDKK